MWSFKYKTPAIARYMTGSVVIYALFAATHSIVLVLCGWTTFGKLQSTDWNPRSVRICCSKHVTLSIDHYEAFAELQLIRTPSCVRINLFMSSLN